MKRLFAALLMLLVVLPELNAPIRSEETTAKDNPAARAQAETFKWRLKEYREGKMNAKEALPLLNSLVSIYTRLGEVEEAKRYEQEIAELKAKHPELGIGERGKKQFQKLLSKYEGMLQEHKQGKREHRDAHLILKSMLGLHVLLGEKDKARERN